MTKDGFRGVVQRELYAASYSFCQLWFYRAHKRLPQSQF